MTRFRYIARSANGSIDQGTVDAASAEDARELLRKRGLMTETVQEEGAHVAETGIADAMPWRITDEEPESSPDSSQRKEPDVAYVALTDTLRLFAGWLLAWYALIYLLGSFQLTGRLSADIPFLPELFASWLVLRFTFGLFMFLLLSSAQRALRGTALSASIFTSIWVILMVLFHLNA